jgi:hypothetical protein
MTEFPAVPASAVAPADLPLEQHLLHTLQAAQVALAGTQLHEAAQLMQTANALCELALREPARVSHSGLAEAQRLFAVCLEVGRPLQDRLMQRMAEHATVAKAAKAYRPRRGAR